VPILLAATVMLYLMPVPISKAYENYEFSRTVNDLLHACLMIETSFHYFRSNGKELITLVSNKVRILHLRYFLKRFDV